MPQGFSEKTERAVRKIPVGKVAAYGQIAGLIHTPRAARAVGLVLRNLPTDTNVPWHRVVNSRGMISLENLQVPKLAQVKRLQKEGITVRFRGGNWWVDLKKYLWRPQKGI